MSKPGPSHPAVPTPQAAEDTRNHVDILTELNQLGVMLATGLLQRAEVTTGLTAKTAAEIADSYERIANAVQRNVQLIDKLLGPVAPPPAAGPRQDRKPDPDALIEELRRRMAERARPADPKPATPPPRKGSPYLH